MADIGAYWEIVVWGCPEESENKPVTLEYCEGCEYHGGHDARTGNVFAHEGSLECNYVEDDDK